MSKYPAISLTRIGTTCVVSIEVGNDWVPVIIDPGEVISHIIEPLEIDACIARTRRGREVADWEAPHE